MVDLDDDEDDDGDGDDHVLEDSFTLLYCELLTARSFHRNSGERPLVGPVLSRYARILWTYSSSSLVFCPWKAEFFAADMALNVMASMRSTKRVKTIAQASGVGHSESIRLCCNRSMRRKMVAMGTMYSDSKVFQFRVALVFVAMAEVCFAQAAGAGVTVA